MGGDDETAVFFVLDITIWLVVELCFQAEVFLEERSIFGCWLVLGGVLWAVAVDLVGGGAAAALIGRSDGAVVQRKQQWP